MKSEAKNAENIDFKPTSLNDEEKFVNQLLIEDMDSAPEIMSLINQWVIGSLLILLGVPFSPTLTLETYENAGKTDPLTFTYDWWWVGALFLCMTIVSMILFLWQKRENMTVAIIRTFLSVIVFFCIAVVMNSLWMHGSFIYTGYFTSLNRFFCSDIVVSMMFGIISVGITAFIPVKNQAKYVSFLEKYCDDKNRCIITGYEPFYLKKITQK